MNAILAIIADGGRAIGVIDREAVEINNFLLLFIDSAKIRQRRPWPTPSAETRRWGMFLRQTHGTGGGNGPIMVGMFVCLCLASKKPSEWEFFVPTRTHLGVKLLI